MPRYQVNKIFFVEADDIEHAKRLAEKLEDHSILEIDLIEEGDECQETG